MHIYIYRDSYIYIYSPINIYIWIFRRYDKSTVLSVQLLQFNQKIDEFNKWNSTEQAMLRV